MKIRTNYIKPDLDEKGTYWDVSVAAWDGGCACEAKLYKFKMHQKSRPSAEEIKAEIRKMRDPVVL